MASIFHCLFPVPCCLFPVSLSPTHSYQVAYTDAESSLPMRIRHRDMKRLSMVKPNLLGSAQKHKDTETRGSLITQLSRFLGASLSPCLHKPRPVGQRHSPTDPASQITSARSVASGYNLVEVLVTLTIVSIITITLVSFVNDIDTRQKVTIAKADINRISMAAHLAEAEMDRVTTAPASSLGILNLTPTSRLAWSLSRRLLDLPDTDPWGNQFVGEVSDNSTISYLRVTSGLDLSQYTTYPPSPYIIDEGLGRVISAGPDGTVDTRIGQDPADAENDLVIEYRHKPWLFYNVGGKMYVNSADGGANLASGTVGIYLGDGVNAQVSPDGLRYAAIRDTQLVIGTLAWALQTDGAAPTPRTNEVIVAPRNRALTHTVNGWIENTAAVTVNSSVFPLWMPDSSGILFVLGSGELYRYDPARGATTGPARGELIRLTAQRRVNVQGATQNERVLLTTRRSASYMDKDLATWLTVSADGKVAFRADDNTIWAILGDGTARRRIKSGGVFNPVAWLDNNNLAYWDENDKRIWRIAQDGTIDIPLHDSSVRITDVVNPVLSPAGKYLAFLEDSSKGYLLKTDGTGFVTKELGTKDKFFRASDFAFKPPIVWRRKSDCAGNLLFYIPKTSKTPPISNQAFSRKDTFVGNPVAVNDPENCDPSGSTPFSTRSNQAKLLEGLTTLYFALSPDQKLLAVLSSTDSDKRDGDGTEGGVFIVPLPGSSNAVTQLDLPTVPDEAQYNYVAWLAN